MTETKNLIPGLYERTDTDELQRRVDERLLRLRQQRVESESMPRPGKVLDGFHFGSARQLAASIGTIVALCGIAYEGPAVAKFGVGVANSITAKAHQWKRDYRDKPAPAVITKTTSDILGNQYVHTTTLPEGGVDR